jgi:hypothetical protein
MMEFITNPIVEVVDDNTFILRSEFTVKYFDHYITVPENFTTDFASVPRIPIAFTLFGSKAKRSAVLHDYLYTTKPFSREECDKAFLCAMESEGLGWFTRHAMYRGVRLGGSAYWAK